MITPHGLGYIREHDGIAGTDLLGLRRGSFRLGEYPATCDWRDRVQDCIFDQFLTSSCVGHAMANAITLCQRVAGGDEDAKPPSRLHIYDMARGAQRADIGTTLFAAAETTAKHGYLLEHERPWNPWDIDTRMSWGQGHLSAARAGLRHHRVLGDRVELIKAIVGNGYGLCVGMDVGPAFQDWKRGQIYDGESMHAGGHAVAVVGYNDKAALMIQSWGRDYADDGFVYVSWRYLCDVLRTRSVWAVDAVPKQEVV